MGNGAQVCGVSRAIGRLDVDGVIGLFGLELPVQLRLLAPVLSREIIPMSNGSEWSVRERGSTRNMLDNPTQRDTHEHSGYLHRSREQPLSSHYRFLANQRTVWCL